MSEAKITAEMLQRFFEEMSYSKERVVPVESFFVDDSSVLAVLLPRSSRDTSGPGKALPGAGRQDGEGGVK